MARGSSVCIVKIQRKRNPKRREKGVKNACGEEVGLSIGI